jgi:hypothetical protein
MIPYYRSKWIGLGDSTVFSWAGCHSVARGGRADGVVVDGGAGEEG